jgi:hypothetical protein
MEKRLHLGAICDMIACCCEAPVTAKRYRYVGGVEFEEDTFRKTKKEKEDHEKTF